VVPTSVYLPVIPTSVKKDKGHKKGKSEGRKLRKKLAICDIILGGTMGNYRYETSSLSSNRLGLFVEKGTSRKEEKSEMGYSEKMGLEVHRVRNVPSSDP